MKKILLFSLLFSGVLSYAQSKALIIHNRTKFTLEGRLITATPGTFYPTATAAPDPGVGIYQIPPYTHDITYKSLDTSGSSSVPINLWSVNTAPQTGGTYSYTNPYLTTSIVPNVEWGAFIFRTVDYTGQTHDSFDVGNSSVYPTTLNTIQYGVVDTNVYAEWIEFSDKILLVIQE